MKRATFTILICSLPFLVYVGLHVYPYDLSGEEAEEKYYIEYRLPGEMLPIFYRDEYNIKFWGIEKLHPFDSRKYGKVFHRLVESNVIQADRVVHPSKPKRDVLLKLHTDRYLKSLEISGNIARIAEVFPLRYLPWRLLHTRILNPMLYATGGTILAARAALERGWAINLGGGFHHASADNGGGFCFYDDIALGVKILRSGSLNPIKIMIVDLDAHQGNGYEKDFLKDDSIYILDMYNADIYPNDIKAKLSIDRNIELRSGIGDSDYLDRLAKELEQAFGDFAPDLIIYNAGTDIMAGDPLGGMNISEQGIIQRDEMVFRMALSKKVPIVMLLSGGYRKENAAVIAKSIENILRIIPRI